MLHRREGRKESSLACGPGLLLSAAVFPLMTDPGSLRLLAARPWIQNTLGRIGEVTLSFQVLLLHAETQAVVYLVQIFRTMNFCLS